MLYQYVTENFPTKRADPPRRKANAAWPGKVGGAAKADEKSGHSYYRGPLDSARGCVMDAFVKRCEHCGEPVPETKRGRPQQFCSDAHAKRTGKSMPHPEMA